MGDVIAFPARGAGLEPYAAWRAAREGGGLPYDPPLAALLASPGVPTAWTTHAGPGEDPRRLRVQVYVRKAWRGDQTALAIGNIGPAGDALGGPAAWLRDDPVARPGPVRDLMAAALGEAERLAAGGGYARIAVEDPCGPLRDLLLDRGYADEGGDLVAALAPGGRAAGA